VIEDPPLSFPEAKELADVVATLRRSMRRTARSAAPGNPLSVAQLELLSCVGEHPGDRPGEIASLLHLAPNSVATLITGLAAGGYLRREISGEDRRAAKVTLTQRGTRAVDEWSETNARIVADALATLHPAWRQLLIATLPAMWHLIDAIDSQAPGAEQPPALAATSQVQMPAGLLTSTESRR